MTSDDADALKAAIKALESQPCEDCISREAVIKIFGEVHPMDYNTQAYITNIQNLPSVTPQPKMGQWNILSDIWECSRCESMVMGYDGLNYCPNCGAKMEVEE